MINKIAKVTIYVNNQDEAKKFWTEKLNFVTKIDETERPLRWIEVAPKESEWVTIVLYDKNLMKTKYPNSNTDYKTVILSTEDLDNAYKEMKAKGVEVTQIVTMPYAKLFTFKDQDNNEYLLREDKFKIKNI
ncbi:VOC family protein [Terrisporobacter glycolicus]|uniref:VOC domain-containing protein n=1 Tax=Terrisporobacter glycolicus ATCC 14880 = DSM 1288 TaxID=1121315 RepID=A0ABZ2EYB3_9FIRM|nr:VOC family protein [Terrisporobacter glycolicus]